MRKALCPLVPFLLILFSLFGLRVATSADDLDNVIFEGSVKDGAGAVIPLAKVVAIHVATNVERSASTNDEGRYRIAVALPGAYRLKVITAGFREQQSDELTTITGRVYSIDFTLAPSGVSEQVTVTASAAPLVDTARTVVGDTITRSELDELPIFNRDIFQLVFLLGGVTEAPLSTADLAEEGEGVFLRGTPEEAGSLSLTGAPATSNNITIDGLDNNDDRTARERIALPPESIAEVQIITNQYAAEYGRASGGRINIRTRAGANNFRGDAYFYFGDESLNANTYYRNARGLGRIAQQQRREGATITGPIQKNKSFFLAGYERSDVTDFAEIRTFLPIQSNPLFPLPAPNLPADSGFGVARFEDEIYTPETRNLVNGRADFNFNQSHNSTVRFDAQRGANKRGFPGGSRLAETILIEGRNSDSISVTDNFIFSNRLVNQARFQYSRLLPRSKAALDSVGIIIEEPSRILAGAFTGSDSAPAFAREERRAQIQDSLSMILGSHLIKVGGDLQLVRASFTDLFATGGQYSFESVDDFLANRPSRFTQRFDSESRLSNNVMGLFIQDEWKVRPNLTLSFGVRWDNESILDDRDNFSPRVAIAWDPFGGKLFRSFNRNAKPGKTVVRAGFGLFYNRALLRTIDDFSLGVTSIIVDSNITPDVLARVNFPQPISDRSVINSFGIKETGFLRRISPDLEIPYTIQSGIGIERQIAKRAVITADYVFTRGAHLWRETNINAPVLPEGFSSFTEFLLSRDFDNRRNISGARPLTGANADVVRFDLGGNTSTSPGAIQIVNGVRLVTLGLNAPRSSNISTALNAVRFLRPDPALTQVEMLESTGNSFYHGGVFSLKYAAGRLANLRVVYTLAKLIDEGTTNTASPQDLFDRRAERALSLQDQRHRISFSGLFRVPHFNFDLSSIVSLGSSKPFNIGAGFDRNLNDIQNDRPNFIAPIERPVWRRPQEGGDVETKSKLALAPIGSAGNLPRNYGRGPGTRSVNFRAARTFAVTEKISLRPAIDVFNLFNNTLFSFGSEFINSDDEDFLVSRRTQRPRSVQLSLKASF